jgi:acetyltransferase-like isoleucine patch superfamily enzyme
MNKLLKKISDFMFSGRNLNLSQLSLYRLVSIFVRFSFAMLRSLLRLRKVGFVMRDVEIRSPHLLRSSGIFILEKGVLLDCYGDVGLSLGNNFKLGRSSIISVPGSISSKGFGVTIGHNVGIGDFSYIGGEGYVEIGDNTISGQYLSIHPENHTSETSGIFRDSPTHNKGIVIGSNVWIGAKVTILDGAEIGDNCIIAAGAVVIGQFPPGNLIAGVPAKIKAKL